ncbi:class I SAM-dependent methyltransferase [Endozoicomonas montiporae]|uniref:Uncharacterized protein n=1 Tax=Endozoicomonas montiporae CL-33 TaxID=570277 RepID=A0A142BFD5_9GAMM|nr:class I SAM-dependent methyltransferase [Endozoicomonas montiporae]AMO57461.1 hypothetical protein EZMO1_3473 [Endozoicomonas montiporae CL-33]
MIEQYMVAPYDWSQQIRMNDLALPKGDQVINFFSANKPYRDCPDNRQFVETYLSRARVFSIDAQVLHYACDQIAIKNGFIMEMGVCTGRTINFIAALNPASRIYGFDSFEGLPQPWNGGEEYNFPTGEFGFKERSAVPPVLHNVCLIKGLFSETLPVFSREILQEAPISFLHMDCDIYQSATEVFQHLGHRLVPGSVVVFDELYNYPNWKEHEWKALQEFLKATDKQVEFIAFNENWGQVAVRFTD